MSNYYFLYINYNSNYFYMVTRLHGQTLRETAVDQLSKGRIREVDQCTPIPL